MGREPIMLDVSFGDPEEFEQEYTNNVANGGIFIATDREFEVRAKVNVRLKLRFLGKGITLRGEVVHVVGEELAASGAIPGVAVQFETPAAELRELFEPLVEASRASAKPKKRAQKRAQKKAQKKKEKKDREETPKRAVVTPVRPAHDERRAAPRLRARVRARVDCPGCEPIEGRTRDLSISGLLISVGNVPAIDIGEPVKVLVTNPETGAERQILGKIARHVKGEGDVVRAIGVQFYVRDDERQAVEAFLEDLSATEHTRHLGGIAGDIAEIGLINLVQTFGLASREGTLDVIRQNEEGYLAFENGNLRAASLGGTRGVKALARMLMWPDGTFEFHARIDPGLVDDETPMSLEAALLEAIRLTDESQDVDRTVYPANALIQVDTAGRDVEGDLTKLEEAILDLATAGMNVQRILDIVPETDAEIYLAMASLTDRDLITIVA
jgi:Tfp pilus assembly protein PilZ